VFDGVSIGDVFIIGTNSLVADDVPPFRIAVENSCRIVMRFDFFAGERVSVRQWSDDEKKLPTKSDYLSPLIQKNPLLKHSYVAASRAFGWLHQCFVNTFKFNQVVNRYDI